MLRNKSNGSSRTQNQKYNYASDCPSSDNYRFGTELVFVPQLLPVATNNVSSNPAVAAGQISWAHQAISNETAFRKMFSLTFVGEETGVSRWGWCSPRTHNATISFQGHRVLGVYASYGAPVQSGKSKDVVYNDFRFGNFDAWIPEQQPSEEAKPNVDPDSGNENWKRLSSKGNCAKQGKGYGQNRHDFARAGSKKLGIHPLSFTQSATEEGAEK